MKMRGISDQGMKRIAKGLTSQYYGPDPSRRVQGLVDQFLKDIAAPLYPLFQDFVKRRSFPKFVRGELEEILFSSLMEDFIWSSSAESAYDLILRRIAQSLYADDELGDQYYQAEIEDIEPLISDLVSNLANEMQVYREEPNEDLKGISGRVMGRIAKGLTSQHEEPEYDYEQRIVNGLAFLAQGLIKDAAPQLYSLMPEIDTDEFSDEKTFTLALDDHVYESVFTTLYEDCWGYGWNSDAESALTRGFVGWMELLAGEEEPFEEDESSVIDASKVAGVLSQFLPNLKNRFVTFEAQMADSEDTYRPFGQADIEKEMVSGFGLTHPQGARYKSAGFFSWNCHGCGKSLRSTYSNSPDWMMDVVVLEKDGKVLEGSYDGYGRVDGEQIEPTYDRTGENYPACWHRRCWEEAGRPEYADDGPSTQAGDQGFFV